MSYPNPDDAPAGPSGPARDDLTPKLYVLWSLPDPSAHAAGVEVLDASWEPSGRSRTDSRDGYITQVSAVDVSALLLDAPDWVRRLVCRPRAGETPDAVRPTPTPDDGVRSAADDLRGVVRGIRLELTRLAECVGDKATLVVRLTRLADRADQGIDRLAEVGGRRTLPRKVRGELVAAIDRVMARYEEDA